MTLTVMGMVQMASADLHFAQAEISTMRDRESILRSLEHIRQAEAFLLIALAGYDATLTAFDSALTDDRDVGRPPLS